MQPGHFQVTEVVRQVMHFFPQRSFLVAALNTQATNAADGFTVKMKQIKRAVTHAKIFSERELRFALSSFVRLSSVCNVRAPYSDD